MHLYKWLKMGLIDGSDTSANCKVTASLKIQKEKNIILCRAYGNPKIV